MLICIYIGEYHNSLMDSNFFILSSKPSPFPYQIDRLRKKEIKKERKKERKKQTNKERKSRKKERVERKKETKKERNKERKKEAKRFFFIITM